MSLSFRSITILFFLAACTGCQKAETPFPPESTVPASFVAEASPLEVLANQTAVLRNEIETVLREDAQTAVGTQDAGVVAARMRLIDTSDCPADFRMAYLAHVHAWESLRDAEADLQSLRKFANSGEAFVAAFIRGYNGEPFGEVNDALQAEQAIKQQMADASEGIASTFREVERVALLYGVTVDASSASP